MKAGLPLALLAACLAWSPPARAGDDLMDLSLEDLLAVEVTSVSRKPQKLSDTAAAVFVITREDIRRSGATSIPEALRMAPGLQVARIDANKWVVTARGFADRFSNKLLVLVDGRSVYTPLFSGVYWDVQDTLLEDVDRIEVIRGPGAALWGANAVNGVINIITRHAADTQGGLVTAGGGTEARAFGGARYGGALGEGAQYRLFAKGAQTDKGEDASGREGADAWHALRGGLRLDARPSARDAVLVTGEAYRGEAGTRYLVPRLPPPGSPGAQTGEIVEDDGRFWGGHLLGRWSRTLSPASDLALQLYYDRTDRRELLFGERRDTLDADFQHRFGMARHELVWGFGYRLTRGELETGEVIAFDPSTRTDQLWSAFVQDDVTLVPERLRLTLGSKFEHNDYTGFEVQPNARLLWTPLPRHSFWAAVSRAVRTPSQGDAGARIRSNVTLVPDPRQPGATFPVQLVLEGSEDFGSESLLAYEAGYRAHLAHELSLDVTGFHHRYRDLRSFEPQEPELRAEPVPHAVQALRWDNRLEGRAWGVETAADWFALPWWRLQLAHTWFLLELRARDGSADFFSENDEGRSPRHQVSLRSSLDVTSGLELDVWLRRVSRLPQDGVESYTALDVRLGWSPREDLELSVAGQNLLDRRRAEFEPGQAIRTLPTEAERGVYGRVTLRF
ncbi:MAG: TonB-dependent receptor [Thermodesulfobacteriota bacterium]